MADSLPLASALDILERTGAESPLHRSLAGLLDRRLAPGMRLPPARPARAPRFLTIGMATFDDYDGVYFSVQAIRLFHPEITPLTEIVVIDNNPDGACAEALRKLETQVEGYRYVPLDSVQGTAVRDFVFRESESPWVLLMDSHVFFAPGSLARLIAFLQTQPDSRDLLQGPMLGDDLAHLSACFLPVWCAGMYGVWAPDPRAADPDNPPFDIPMQGAGVFACRRDAWPGFNPRFSGFGGEEGYLHEKIRRAGGRTLCLPFLRWLHRFDRPAGAPYRPVWRQRIRNYLIGWDELGLDVAPVKQHFRELLGDEEAGGIIDAVEREMNGPFHSFDAVYSTGSDRNREPWAALGLDLKIRFLPAEDTAHSPEIGRVLAHRAIVDEARRQQLGSVLVFDADFRPEEAGTAGEAVARGCSYRREQFDKLLEQWPATPSGVALWLRRQK